MKAGELARAISADGTMLAVAVHTRETMQKILDELERREAEESLVITPQMGERAEFARRELAAMVAEEVKALRDFGRFEQAKELEGRYGSPERASTEESPSDAAMDVLKQYQTAIADLNMRQLEALFLPNDGTPEAKNRERHLQDVRMAFVEVAHGGRGTSLVFEKVKQRPAKDGFLISAEIEDPADKEKAPQRVKTHVVRTEEGWRIRNIIQVTADEEDSGEPTENAPDAAKNAIRLYWKAPEIRLTAGDTYRTQYLMIQASQPLPLRMQGTPQPVRMEIVDGDGRLVAPAAGSPETFGANQGQAEYEQDRWDQFTGEPFPSGIGFSLPANGYHLEPGTYKLRIHYTNRKPINPSEDPRPAWIGEVSSPWVPVVVVPRAGLPLGKTVDGLKLTVTLKNPRARLLRKRVSGSLEEPLVFQAVLQNTGTEPRTVIGPLQYYGRAWIASSSARFKESKEQDTVDEEAPRRPITVGPGSSHSFQYEAKSFYGSDGRRLFPGKFDCYLEIHELYSNPVPLEILPIQE